MPHEEHPMKLTGADAHRLADMAGIADDLTAAAWAAKRLRTEVKSWVNDDLIEALQDSALIRYGRIFNKGARDRFRIPKERLSELPEDLREAQESLAAAKCSHCAFS